MLLKLEKPTLNQAQSAVGPSDGCLEFSIGFALSLSVCTLFFRKQEGFANDWQKIADSELKIWELFLKSPRFLAPGSLLGNRLKIEIYTDARARAPFGKASIN